jgi:1,6-anhydro-N-acetylmuramate kinase
LQQATYVVITSFFISLQTMAWINLPTMRQAIFHHEKPSCAPHARIFAKQNIFPHYEISTASDVTRADCSAGDAGAPEDGRQIRKPLPP